MSGERKRYIDLIKGIGIILVIMGYINFANSFIKEWIYLYHMTLFFFFCRFGDQTTDKQRICN